MKTHTRGIKALLVAVACAMVMNLAQAEPPKLTYILERFYELEARVAELETALAEEQAARQALADKLACVADGSDNTNVYFEGCNVHVRNGLGQTDSINGAGNLIVGYDKARPDLYPPSDKTGSHNLVVGDSHNYNSFGGLVAGFHNTISGEFVSVSGGTLNTASGVYASVSGGKDNVASGPVSSVKGGEFNVASGTFASVNGGLRNTASGIDSSISGGDGCEVTLDFVWAIGDTTLGDIPSTSGCVITNSP